MKALLFILFLPLVLLAQRPQQMLLNLPAVAAAASSVWKTNFITTTGGGTWTVPSDWNSSQNIIECIGGGGAANGKVAAAAYGGSGAQGIIVVRWKP